MTVSARTGYRLSVSLTGFRSSTANVTVTAGQTSTSNFTLQPATAIRALSASGSMRVYAGPAGRLILELPAAPLPGRVRAFDARGVNLFAGILRAGQTSLEIPWATGRSGYVLVERGGEFHRFAVITAR